MYYSSDKEDPKCKIITMESMVSMVLTNVPTYNHNFNKNPPHCKYHDNINPGMYSFLKKAHYHN